MNVTDICNMALSYLGKGRIASLDEQSENARQCKLFYTYTKNRLLREYSWGFAKRITQLAELDTVNPFWSHVYAYPSKCLCVRRIFNCTDILDENKKIKKAANLRVMAEDRDKYEIYMVSDNVRGIACDTGDAWLEYTYDIDDLNVCSSDFIEALTHMLAYEIALALTANMQLKNSEYQQAMAVLNRAKYTSAAEEHKQVQRPQGYFEARG